jgi:hypothetical protein
MCSKNKELFNHVRKAIETEGAVIVSRSVTGSGHHRLDFVVAGRRGWFLFAVSPRQGKDLNVICAARRVVRAARAVVP